ncbi:MAG TPA: hypothetical protein VHY37_14400, partial [Tepidisphaeraceae bacterium]|nr:hypothetical protein [Tepidisphaeraceae bacterium]
MRPILPKLAMVATILLLGLAAAAGVAWLKEAVPVGDIPDRPFGLPGRNPPIELASIPWKRDPAHPEDVRQPLAVGGLAWLSSADRPRPVNVPGAVLPWSRGPMAPVNLTVAAVPWSAQPP